MQILKQLLQQTKNDLFLLEDAEPEAVNYLETKKYDKLAALIHERFDRAVEEEDLLENTNISINNPKYHELITELLIRDIKFTTFNRLTCNCDLIRLFENPHINNINLIANKYKIENYE